MKHLLLATCLALGPACHTTRAASTESSEADEPAIERVAFASCFQQARPQPGWSALLAGDPELFLFLGDNIYGDTDDPEQLAGKWSELAAQPGYLDLVDSCTVLGTWDDHDYGRNDAGAEYPSRAESQQVFLDFFGVGVGSPRRARAGVWHAETFGPPGRRIQVVLLDTRYHRTALERAATRPPDTGPYVPNPDPAGTVLGEEQWEWLETVLREPAELRLLVSSIQLIANEHGWEKWGNHPHERARMLELLATTGAGGVIVLSGDRHSAEIMRLPPGAEGPSPAYPLYEITASAFNQSVRPTDEPNRYRIAGRYFDPNFGTLDVDWETGAIRIAIVSDAGQLVYEERTSLKELGVAGPE